MTRRQIEENWYIAGDFWKQVLFGTRSLIDNLLYSFPLISLSTLSARSVPFWLPGPIICVSHAHSNHPAYISQRSPIMELTRAELVAVKGRYSRVDGCWSPAADCCLPAVHRWQLIAVLWSPAAAGRSTCYSPTASHFSPLIACR